MTAVEITGLEALRRRLEAAGTPEPFRKALREEAEAIGHKPPELMSGPFHDSLAMSYVCEYGMIFVRCLAGISHNPKEFASPEDIALGTELLYRTARRIVLGL